MLVGSVDVAGAAQGSTAGSALAEAVEEGVTPVFWGALDDLGYDYHLEILEGMGLVCECRRGCDILVRFRCDGRRGRKNLRWFAQEPWSWWAEGRTPVEPFASEVGTFLWVFVAKETYTVVEGDCTILNGV